MGQDITCSFVWAIHVLQYTLNRPIRQARLLHPAAMYRFRCCTHHIENVDHSEGESGTRISHWNCKCIYDIRIRVFSSDERINRQKYWINFDSDEEEAAASIHMDKHRRVFRKQNSIFILKNHMILNAKRIVVSFYYFFLSIFNN